MRNKSNDLHHLIVSELNRIEQNSGSPTNVHGLCVSSYNNALYRNTIAHATFHKISCVSCSLECGAVEKGIPLK